MKKIKALVMDVDGTLTDGGIYMGENGEVMKRFNIKDGYAIHDILPEKGIIPIVITGRSSSIVENRCKELGIKEFHQGCNDKLQKLKKVLRSYEIQLDEVAFIGDDLNDLDCMNAVGIAGCPSDAVDEIKTICDFVAKSAGGYGVVREFVNWIK